MQNSSPSVLVAVAATFTADPLAESLEFWFAELGLPHTVQFAPAHQVFQQLVDPGSLLNTHRAGVNVVLIRWQDWAGGAGDDSLHAELAEHAENFGSALRSRSWAVPVFLVALPPSPDFTARPERRFACEAAQERLRSMLSGVSGLYWIEAQEIERYYPVAHVHDPYTYQLGGVPYTPVYFTALGTLLARKIQALSSPPFKVIALDCDDTLWRGTCGEDGPEGVQLDEPRLALQRFMLRQRDAGMLLTLVSKNNPHDVFDTFRAHPEMPLQPEHFVAWRINWASKADNLRSLAEELDLSLDSFIFVDDNPKECAEVQAALPEVVAVPLPTSEAEIPEFLEHVWAFDRLRITEEDRRRSELYSREMERGRLLKQVGSLEEFLAALQLEIDVHPLKPEELPRAAQLTQRTNQMNSTTIRRSEAEIQALLQSGAECLTVHVKDRFGSYGLTGLIILRQRESELEVESFLLSCRVLGRGVEHRLLAYLGELAAERGLTTLRVPFRKTARNLAAQLFLESVALEYMRAEQESLSFCIPVAAARAIRFQPTPQPVPPKPAAAAQSPQRRRVDYAGIAARFRDPETILRHIRSSKGTPAGPATFQGSDLERRLAEIWAQTLAVPTVGPHDNFFDLGGHSLLALELLSRVRQALNVELSLEVVYSSDFTVAQMAALIEKQQGGLPRIDDYEALLAQIESLTDEQVRALLAEQEAEERSE